jgi:hypothetical protein
MDLLDQLRVAADANEQQAQREQYAHSSDLASATDPREAYVEVVAALPAGRKCP